MTQHTGDSVVTSPTDARATDDVLTALLDRTLSAEMVVKRLARDSAVAKSSFASTERHRLEGKAEGLRIAISYIREELR